MTARTSQRLAGLPGRQLFPHRRPGRPVWRIGPRHRHQHRVAGAGRISPLLAILAGGAWPETVTIYALLEGPSVTGAYKFDAARQRMRVVMDVHCELFFRGDISRLGVAPLTSMYWYGENQRARRPTGGRRFTTMTGWRCGPARASASGGR
jgi:hypothetical protein